MAVAGISAFDDNSREYLFACLAEQLKIPILQVSQIVERLEDGKDLSSSRQEIMDISKSAQKLINSFLLSLEISQSSKLELEPVSVSSLLYDTADSLQSYARLHNCNIELQVSGRNGPVMARADILKSALESLAITLINASASGKKKSIKLSVRRNGRLVSTGVYAQHLNLNSPMLERARYIYGRSHQPLSEVASDSSAGVFLADSLITSLGSSMKVSSLGKFSGLSANFAPSRQLSLV